MSIRIVIGGTPIDVPNTTENPNWGPAMVQFFRAVENAFSLALGPYDIPPQVFDITGDAYNPAVSPLNVKGLSFSTTVVRAVFIQYSVFRTATAATAWESGNIIAVYNGTTWDVERDRVGDGKITFSITDTGQVQFVTTAIGTNPHSGKISFKATALTKV
jgi:hypothetical protein